MLKMAICDDQSAELKELLALVTEYITEKNIKAQVCEFSHPDALLTAMQTERFHLYILDIVMPMMSGLEMGREIRRLDREAQIIFVTTEPQFALQAYAASPVNYLIKPIDNRLLFDTLSLAISTADLAEKTTFTVKTVDSLHVVRFSDIACCEYRAHAVIFTLISGEELKSRSIRESFTDYAAPILKDRHFLLCHSSFVINMRRVEFFAKGSFTLIGGKTVPIAAKQYPAVRDTYMDDLMAKRVGR